MGLAGLPPEAAGALSLQSVQPQVAGKAPAEAPSLQAVQPQVASKAPAGLVAAALKPAALGDGQL
jgi:hypothetical protein